MACDGKGLAGSVERLKAVAVERIAVEATGGYATVVAAALACVGLRPLPAEAKQMLADPVARRRQIDEMIVAEKYRDRRALVRRIRWSIVKTPHHPQRYSVTTNHGNPLDIRPSLRCERGGPRGTR